MQNLDNSKIGINCFGGLSDNNDNNENENNFKNQYSFKIDDTQDNSKIGINCSEGLSENNDKSENENDLKNQCSFKIDGIQYKSQYFKSHNHDAKKYSTDEGIYKKENKINYYKIISATISKCAKWFCSIPLVAMIIDYITQIFSEKGKDNNIILVPKGVRQNIIYDKKNAEVPNQLPSYKKVQQYIANHDCKEKSLSII